MQITFKSYNEMMDFARNIMREEHAGHIRDLEARLDAMADRLDGAQDSLVAVRADLRYAREENASLQRQLDAVRAQQRLNENETFYVGLSREIGMIVNANNAINLIQSHNNETRKVIQNMLPGQKIPQIKLIRTLTGCGLREGKMFVEGDPLVL